MPYGSGGDYDGNEPMSSGKPNPPSVVEIIGMIIAGILAVAVLGFLLALGWFGFAPLGVLGVIALIWLMLKT